MRGCGDSTGKVQDEYVLQEQEDAVECINWIKRQPWCSGNVGMMGISWGGFNALQVRNIQFLLEKLEKSSLIMPLNLQIIIIANVRTRGQHQLQGRF